MNWLEIKALNDLYCGGEVRLNETLSKSSELRFLEQSFQVLHFATRSIQRLSGYEEVYEQRYLDKYNQYFTFLQRHDLLRPQTRLDEKDILILMGIESGLSSGELSEIRNQIIASEESLRGVSLMFFKHEKYLDTRTSLAEALKKVLNIAEFSNEKDQQYIYRLECHHPKAIVLCENVDYLRKPSRPRAAGIELWYAGGKNVEKLSYSDTRGLAIYYSCDWDYDGLCIIYPLVKQKIPTIDLLTPTGSPRSIAETEHASIWQLSKLQDTALEELFSPDQFQLIRQLAEAGEWIIEESNDLMRMFAETSQDV